MNRLIRLGTFVKIEDHMVNTSIGKVGIVVRNGFNFLSTTDPIRSIFIDIDHYFDYKSKNKWNFDMDMIGIAVNKKSCPFIWADPRYVSVITTDEFLKEWDGI